MTSVYESTVLLIIVVALGGFLFLAAAVIFLLEEAARYAIHCLGESTVHAWEWLSHRAKGLNRLRWLFYNAKL